ncbi:MAG: hypothetical protein IPJ98_05830 [Bryobacterales bacterium]|nr:hypothetical protein [Bryobacterales bacterium]
MLDGADNGGFVAADLARPFAAAHACEDFVRDEKAEVEVGGFDDAGEDEGAAVEGCGEVFEGSAGAGERHLGREDRR